MIYIMFNIHQLSGRRGNKQNIKMLKITLNCWINNNCRMTLIKLSGGVKMAHVIKF